MKKKLLLMLFIAVLSIGNVKASRVDKEKSFEDNYKMVELGTIIENKIANYYNIEKRFEDLYPEYYGGMYISDDSKKIILQIVKDNIPNKNNKDYDFYNEITTMDERIIIEYVNNSFNELNDVNNILSEYIIKRVDDKNIVGAYIDVVNNKTIVELSNSNEINKERIKNVVNKNRQSNIKNEKKSQKKSILNFVQSGDNNLYYTALSGQKIDVGNAYCSLGFRAKFGGKAGYVTAGHCLEGNYKIFSGIVKKVIFSNNGYYDYGFVETNYNYNVSNELGYKNGNITSLGVTNYSPNIFVNMEIAKAGFTTGYTSGKVTGLNQTYKSSDNNGNNVTLKGMVKSNLTAKKGDSGGVVFIPRSNNDGGSIALGVISGGSEGILGIGKAIYFTSINDMLGIFRY